MSIFAVTIRGRKYYFACNLSDNDISRVESYCSHLTNNPVSDEINEQFDSLLNYIREELKLPITPIRKCVFIERVYFRDDTNYLISDKLLICLHSSPVFALQDVIEI